MAINGVSCTSISHASAMSLIDASGNQLLLTVRRYGPLSPQPTLIPLVWGSQCLSQLYVSLPWLQLLLSTHFLYVWAGVQMFVYASQRASVYLQLRDGGVKHSKGFECVGLLQPLVCLLVITSPAKPLFTCSPSSTFASPFVFRSPLFPAHSFNLYASHVSPFLPSPIPSRSL